ncbi:S8 family peptidase [Thermoflavimicrobium daqui]|uniref:S8 family peptidase n=1 Tax=Thermoflavimicrobium daqui TaxID=2137476 RepID=UPI00143CE0C0|nr:S8 family peptidase [Thermoflavimicrobium daqui]
MKFFLPILFSFSLLFSSAPINGFETKHSQEIIVKTKQKEFLNQFGHIIDHNKSLGFYVLRLNNPLLKRQTIQKLKQFSFIQYVEENSSFQTTTFPNDPKYNQQYGLKKVHAKEAWAVTQGKPNTLIATIDTGVNYTHPDLKGKVVKGKDFVEKDNDPMDKNGHGTHCAGIAAAITNNQIGIASMAPKTKILAVRALDENGEGYLSDIASGITYAVDQGAKIINLSLGSSEDSQTLREAVEYADQKGAIVIAAAGNNSSSTPLYPAFYSKVIAVAATDQNDDKADFSNFGTWVDIAAPGVDIWSTWLKQGYQLESGTSMATPLVSGVAGLLASQGKNAKQIRQAIEQSADQVQGTGLYWRNGRLNAEKAVKTKS